MQFAKQNLKKHLHIVHIHKISYYLQYRQNHSFLSCLKTFNVEIISEISQTLIETSPTKSIIFGDISLPRLGTL